MGSQLNLQRHDDLTTNGLGRHPDALALVHAPPKTVKCIPGWQWQGQIGNAKAIVRLPSDELWNGKLLIGATPAVRSEYALDLLLSDMALQKGFAYAACDKATPGLALRDPARSMAEWTSSYAELTRFAKELVEHTYGTQASRTYITGVSNGGYVTRMLLERHADLFDGGVEWEGVLWHSQVRHLLTTLPTYINDYPVYRNWRGDRTSLEKVRSFENLVDAGLHPESEPHWETYYMNYWLVSLWLYGRNLDPSWKPFSLNWSNDWLRDPRPIARYPWREREKVLAKRIAPIANTGRIQKPLLSVAGNHDCLVPYRFHAKQYARMVKDADCSRQHRLYEIDRVNHVDGLLANGDQRQQPGQPFYEAALRHLEAWVESGTLPPPSGLYQDIADFADDPSQLLSIPAVV